MTTSKLNRPRRTGRKKGNTLTEPVHMSWEDDTRVSWMPGPGTVFEGEAVYPGSDPRPVGFVRVGDLIVDQTVQRDTDAVRIEKMKKTWDWKIAEVPTVRMRPNGDIVVVEGQNRVLTLQAMDPDIRTWIVLETTLTSPAEEASTALRIARGRKGHSPLAKWDLMVRQGDRHEVLANAVLAKLGLRLAGYKTPTTIVAIAAISSIIHHGGAKPEDGAVLLEDVLTVIRDSFPEEDPTKWDAVLLRAVRDILVLNPDEEVDLNRLKNALRQRQADRWILAGNSDRTPSKSSNIAFEMVEAYNKGKRQHRLIAW